MKQAGNGGGQTDCDTVKAETLRRWRNPQRLAILTVIFFQVSQRKIRSIVIIYSDITKLLITSCFLNHTRNQNTTAMTSQASRGQQTNTTLLLLFEYRFCLQLIFCNRHLFISLTFSFSFTFFKIKNYIWIYATIAYESFLFYRLPHKHFTDVRYN